VRGALSIGLVLLGACAQAGSSDPGNHGNVDASPVKLDAATKPIDARPLDAAPMVSCTSAATCAAATDLGGVSGDTSNQIVTGTGYQSAWYKVRVTENDSGVFGVAMSFTATLTSPASANYDLYVYVNTGSDVVECTTPNGTATRNGTVASRRILWGETGTFSNGVDDSRTVSIEVRPTATTCAPAQPWQLVVQGNT
jgi:hypothetical protein